MVRNGPSHIQVLSSQMLEPSGGGGGGLDCCLPSQPACTASPELLFGPLHEAGGWTRWTFVGLGQPQGSSQALASRGLSRRSPPLTSGTPPRSRSSYMHFSLTEGRTTHN